MSPPGTPPRPLSGSLSVTGYATLLCFLPIHFLTHRLYPTTPNAPIHSVGPSELDFEFVKFGLQSWPYRCWFLYGGLLSLVAIHATDGTALLWKTWFTDAFWRKGSRRRRLSLVFGICVLPVLTGVYLLAREPLMVFKSTASRFRAVYMESFVYRI
ncbi:hypothetical protein BD779DRAFT_862554 [Infundibulicybe gibba]|nr:hypothetical protein BD779DRAFT_862554 [Infundibulicybe gibba]